MDDFEWDHGYDIKLGLYYVDRNTLDRIPKLSSDWYKKFLSNDSVDDRSNQGKFVSNKMQNYIEIRSSWDYRFDYMVYFDLTEPEGTVCYMILKNGMKITVILKITKLRLRQLSGWPNS